MMFCYMKEIGMEMYCVCLWLNSIYELEVYYEGVIEFVMVMKGKVFI